MLVLGGGVSGLSAAYYLLKNKIGNVTIIEASNTLGGWIHTKKDPSTKLLFEQGPRRIRITGPRSYNTLNLIEKLGIDSKVKPVYKSHPAAKNRLIYVDNRVYTLPSKFIDMFKTVSPFSKPLVYAILNDIKTPKKKCDDDSVYNFAERRFGKEIADYIVSSIINGRSAGDAKNTSVKCLMPKLFEKEQNYGSVVKGYLYSLFENPDHGEVGSLAMKSILENWLFFSFEGGMSELCDALRNEIINDGGNIQMSSRVTEISFQKDSVRCKTENSEIYTNHLISSIPAKDLGPLMKYEHPKLTELLSGIPYVSVGAVNLAYKGNVLKQNSFGILTPPSQKLPLLGIIFDSRCFPQGDWTVITPMIGGDHAKTLFDSKVSETMLLDLGIGHVKSILGITQPPDSYYVSILHDCMPQYTVGHYERVDKIFSYISENKVPLSLIGASYNGIGVSDAIASGKEIADKLVMQ